jgi:Xaa-Pro aminopeptidase
MVTRTIETPFAHSEYEARVDRVKARMEEHGVDVLVSADPANMNYLTGYDASSYYVPQAVVVAQSLDEPLWVGREMDGACALVTTHLDDENILGYGDEYVVDPATRHPMTFLAEALAERGLGDGRIGTEEDSICFTPRGLSSIKGALPNATLVDADLLVNWVRTVKSDAEIEVMREAGRIANDAMETAATVIRPGVRECDAAADVYHKLISGNAEFGGSEPIRPSMPSGEKTATPHLSWTDNPYEDDTAVNIELGGCRHRYHVGLSRTVYLGTPPDSLKQLAEVTVDGFEAMLERVRPGATCHDVASAFYDHVERLGYSKDSRCGYGIGIGYPPAAWIERTTSLAKGDQTVIERNMTLHVVLGMWLDTGGFMFTEAIAVTDAGYESLSTFNRELLAYA